MQHNYLVLNINVIHNGKTMHAKFIYKQKHRSSDLQIIPMLSFLVISSHDNKFYCSQNFFSIAKVNITLKYFKIHGCDLFTCFHILFLSQLIIIELESISKINALFLFISKEYFHANFQLLKVILYQLASFYSTFITFLKSKMNPIIKQPSVKLIPSDPMTNTILIIYCVSGTGVSVPYKAVWRKINPKRGKIQELKSQNGSSYRCSPLDLDCIIQVTVFFQFQNIQMQKIVQSNLVKVSRQLKERRIFLREPIPCKITIDQFPIETKVLFQDSVLFIFSNNPNVPQASFGLHSNDFVPQADSNQHLFRIYLKSNFQDFINFFSTLLGWRPVIKSQTILFSFASDINRDIILLGFAETFLRASDLSQINIPKFLQTHSELDRSGHAKNRSQATLSPANKQKIKLAQRVQMKKSQTKTANQGKAQQTPKQRVELPTKDYKMQNVGGKQTKSNGFFKEHKPDPIKEPKYEQKDKKEATSSPSAKTIAKQKPQQTREYLNVFQSDEEELLTPPPPKVKVQSVKQKEGLSQFKSNPQQQLQNQPSINLRGSFQELQRSFSNVNEETFDKIFGNVESTKKMEAQMMKLRRENEELKKQSELVASLTKQNMQIKKKYHELKQQINRLEMQRKVILTDKLRCQVNWHKQAQQKQQLKKELDYLRQMFKGGLPFGVNFNQERSVKSTSIHDVSCTQRQKDRNRSPTSSFYNK